MKMVQHVKALADNSDDLSSIPGVHHMVKGENQVPKIILWPPHTHYGSWTLLPTCTHVCTCASACIHTHSTLTHIHTYTHTLKFIKCNLKINTLTVVVHTLVLHLGDRQISMSWRLHYVVSSRPDRATQWNTVSKKKLKKYIKSTLGVFLGRGGVGVGCLPMYPRLASNSLWSWRPESQVHTLPSL